MHTHIDKFVLDESIKRVGFAGFPPKEIQRVQHLFEQRGIEVFDGGHIGDGSNMAKRAKSTASRVDVLFLRIKEARHLKPEDVAGARVVHCTSTSQIKRLFDPPSSRKNLAA